MVLKYANKLHVGNGCFNEMSCDRRPEYSLCHVRRNHSSTVTADLTRLKQYYMTITSNSLVCQGEDR